MFSTMKLKRDELMRVDDSSRSSYQGGPGRGPSYRHLACERCRDGKLKCTGQKTGCDRCKEKSLSCVYNDSPRSSRHNRASRGSQGSSRTERQQAVVSSSRKDSTSTSNNCEEQRPPAAVQSPPPRPSSDSRDANTQQQQELPPFDPTAFEQSLRSPMDIDAAQTTSRQDLEFDSDLREILAAMPDEPSVPAEFRPMDLDRASTCEQQPLLAQTTTTMDSVVAKDVLNCFDDFPDILTSPIVADPQPNYAGGSSRNGAPGQYPFLSRPADLSASVVALSASMSRISSPSRDPTPALSRSRSPSDVEGSLSSGSCRCLIQAAAILEAVDVKQSRITSFRPDHLLSFQRHVLRECHSILDCASCSASSSLVLLLALIAEKLVASFRRLPTGNGEWHNLYFGEYRVELAEERLCLMKPLVELQLGKMRSLLRRLWSVSSAENWGRHRQLVRETVQQLQECCRTTGFSWAR